MSLRNCAPRETQREKEKKRALLHVRQGQPSESFRNVCVGVGEGVWMKGLGCCCGVGV